MRKRRAAEQTMGMPATIDHRWTADEVRALPEEPGKRFEVVDGELLVSPSPTRRHQHVSFELAVLIREYLTECRVGTVLLAPSDYELDTHSLVQPDLYVVPLVNGQLPDEQQSADEALLFVEVLSPSTARYDRVVKRGRYQRQRIEYWIVDADARIFERWLPGANQPDVLADRIEWHPAGANAPLVIDLVAFFERVLGKAAGTA